MAGSNPTIIIPKRFGDPTVTIEINNIKYTYPTGVEIEPEYEVYEVIKAALLLEPQLDPNAGAGGGASGTKLYRHTIDCGSGENWTVNDETQPEIMHLYFDIIDTNPNPYTAESIGTAILLSVSAWIDVEAQGMRFRHVNIFLILGESIDGVANLYVEGVCTSGAGTQWLGNGTVNNFTDIVTEL